MRLGLILWLALSSLSAGGLAAQDTAAPPVSPPSETGAQETTPPQLPPAMQAFGTCLGTAEAALAASKPYRVQVASTWLSQRNGQVELSGENHLSLLVGKENSLRLEARELPDQPLRFAAISDGQQLTRVHLPSGKFSQESTADPLGELAGCELTQAILRICGASLLLSSQPKEVVFQQLTQVADLGEDANLRHFQLGLADGRIADVWFTEEAPHLPAKLVTRDVNSVSQDLKQELQITTTFDWELNTTVNAGDFAYTPPAEFQLVSNLAETLSGQGSEELIGQPLPQFVLTGLSGEQVAIEREARPVLLYFWATWAAPTTEDLPGVVEFAKQLEGQGVRVVAVNVAESPETIKAFLEANKIQLDVALDRTGEVVHNLRITELPAVVLIDKEHQVRAIHEEVTRDIRPKLAEELKKMAAEQ